MSIDLSMDEVAQTLHVTLGMLFVLLPVAWGWHNAKIWGSFYALLYACIKEFWFDLHYEDEPTSGGWSGSFKDFAFYVVGIVAANILVLF